MEGTSKNRMQQRQSFQSEKHCDQPAPNPRPAAVRCATSPGFQLQALLDPQEAPSPVARMASSASATCRWPCCGNARAAAIVPEGGKRCPNLGRSATWRRVGWSNTLRFSQQKRPHPPTMKWRITVSIPTITKSPNSNNFITHQCESDR